MVKALRYPLFILLVAVAVSGGMLLFVLPEFVSVYASFNAPLPAFTAAMIALPRPAALGRLVPHPADRCGGNRQPISDGNSA